MTTSDAIPLTATAHAASVAYPQPRTWLAAAACAWSLAYGALGLYWALGGTGFPYGARDSDGIGVSVLTGFRADLAGPLIAVLGLIGAAVALAMGRPSRRIIPRPVLLAFGWAAAATLLLVIPDIRALTFLGYLPALVFAIGFDPVDWPVMLNQGFCLAGGIVWGAATLTYGRATRGTAATRSAPGAPRWGRWVTYAAVALPLPYAATRLAWAAGIPLGISEEFLSELAAGGATVAEVSLSGIALLGALLTLGLVRRWGEIFPRWIPFLAGKRVPPALAVVPATLVSVVLTIGGFGVWRAWLIMGLPLAEGGWGTGLPALAFLPWGITLGLATYAYNERRRRDADAVFQGRSIDFRSPRATGVDRPARHGSPVHAPRGGGRRIRREPR